MIELRIRNLSQLFNTLDPFPFRERDLAPEAAHYIMDCAQDEPPHRQMAIGVDVETGLNETNPADVENAIRLWFASRAADEKRSIKLHFRDARLALIIGVCILSVSLIVAWNLGQSYTESPLFRILSESLVIVGWVVLWRPAEMLLYDWVPMQRRRKLYDRLAAANISVTATARPVTAK